MKKLVVIILLLLTPALVWSWGTVIISGNASSPTSSGESLYVEADTGYDTYATYQTTSAEDNPTPITFYMYIDSSKTILPADNDDTYIFGMGNTNPPSNSTGVIIRLNRKSEGVYRLIARSADYSTYINADMDEWIKVEIDYNRNDTSTITFTSSSYPSGSSSTFTAADAPVQYYSFGAIGNYSIDEDFGCYYDDVSGPFTETFDSVGYDLGICGSSPCWSETIGTGGTVDEDNTDQYH